jgi:cellulose synthase/poly-beta-1,6-N-acetylglucosamine synthase-like glycosyltransferase
MIETLFWLSLAAVIYTYAGYPLILAAAAKLYGRPHVRRAILPSVSLVISVYNEEKFIERKLENCLALDYPTGLLEVLIGSDGSTDGTNRLARPYAARGIRLFEMRSRKGKPSVLNSLLRHARGEIVVFTDARQLFDPGAVRNLAASFADPEVGCASGELVLIPEKNNAGSEAIGLYWKYEKMIRKNESAVNSTVGATGAIYALRKKLFTPIDEDILLDDVFLPLKAVEQGYRAVFEPSAKAYDTVAGTLSRESARKVRTLAGNWQLIVRFRHLLNPLKHRIAFSFISHKLSRVLMPYCLAALLASNFALARQGGLFAAVLAAQLFIYVSAAAGYVMLSSRINVLNTAYVFCEMNVNAVKGLLSFVRNTQKVTWEK